MHVRWRQCVQKQGRYDVVSLSLSAVEYTTKLQRERQNMQDEAEMLRKQIQELNTSIRYALESIEHSTSHRKRGPMQKKKTTT